jgi:Fic family protein
MIAMAWEPIKDLPENWKELASSELNSLRKIWEKQEKKLRELQEYKEFLEKFSREFAIETAVIERVFTIDRGVTKTLIEKGIVESYISHGDSDKPAHEVVEIINDHLEAVEGLFDFVKQKRKLSTSYIKELHQLLLRHQEYIDGMNQFGEKSKSKLFKGEWKKMPNNPLNRVSGNLHQYCPPEHVAQEIDNLIKFHIAHEKMNVPPEIEAAWLHHRFAQIHPFQDGNGRVVRCLASLVFLRGHGFPLIIHREKRDEYIDALEKADDGDLTKLITIFVEQQINAFLRALKISTQTFSTPDKSRSIKVIVSEAAKKLRSIEKINKEKIYPHLIKLTNSLKAITQSQMEDVVQSLKEENLIADTELGDENKKFWFRGQVIKIAKHLDYWADLNHIVDWSKLKIHVGEAVIVISFHSVGKDFTGTLGASAFIEFKHKENGEFVQSQPPKCICNKLFIAGYNENREEVKKRFKEWLNETLLTGLEEWRLFI